MDWYLYSSLACYGVLMIGIGWHSYQSASRNVQGFILGGRNMGAGVTALSAGASDMSGWMLMGLPGAMFAMGLDTLWLALGLLIGALLNYRLVASRLRVHTQIAGDSLTIPDFLAKRFGERKGSLRLVTASVSILFFTLYTAAGLVAGGKLFETVFELPYYLGVLTTIILVVMYTLLGGFKAVSLTDFVQGSIMFVALIAVPFVAVTQFDSMAEVTSLSLNHFDQHQQLANEVSVVAVLSSLAWGLGYFGQPHILVRFMAIRSVAELPKSAYIGMSWMLVSILGAVLTGFVGVAYTQKFQLELVDPETIFIVFSQILFHPFVSGILLSAILAAVMSTISSQLLVSSSSVTEDIYKVFFNRSVGDKQGVLLSRLSVLAVAICATLLALDASSSVLGMVGNAWAGFGAAFGPVILLSLFWPSITRTGALAGICSGALTVVLWITIPESWIGINLSDTLYEIIPGFAMALLSTVLVSKVTPLPNRYALSDFHASHALLAADSK